MDLLCEACGRLRPSVYYFRARGLCLDCFDRLPPEKRAAVVASNPKAPWQNSEADKPTPLEHVFTLSARSRAMATLGCLLAIAWAIVLLDAERRWWTVLFPIYVGEEILRFCWSYFRSPRSVEKHGDELSVVYRGGTREAWPLASLSYRVRRWFGRGTRPALIEVLDSKGSRAFYLWVILMRDRDLLLRILPLSHRKIGLLDFLRWS